MNCCPRVPALRHSINHQHIAMHRACSLLFLLLVVICGAHAALEEEREPHDTMYDTPKPSGSVVFLETFNDDHWTQTWVPSTDPKYTGMILFIIFLLFRVSARKCRIFTRD
jgi:hypothetical protein